MSQSKLALLIKVQKEREEKLQAQFIKAQQLYQQAEQKYQGLANYRTEYIQQSLQQGAVGLGGRQYNQYVAFISKLDEALSQQGRVIQQSRNAAEQRRQSWLKMQTKRKALEKLVEQAQQRDLLLQNRQQQKMADEYAGQRFYQRLLADEVTN
ncbi:flagellar export protein FliJ [Alishewanella jeotgali]|uniref:Flagellar FliJ protein n=1 Tax=Alishewanella jeotgali KCTC 22429 TaxID=1129374 RepID=H3ZBH1_9ALTE|nr:flagellar export protein FliJ [Alishewanella jeotgali]EHR42285.1 flagellar protein [Alishewanella jeotgali KCTC 22429]